MLGRTVARQTATIARSNPQSLVKARGVHIENTVHNVSRRYHLGQLLLGQGHFTLESDQIGHSYIFLKF